MGGGVAGGVEKRAKPVSQTCQKLREGGAGGQSQSRGQAEASDEGKFGLTQFKSTILQVCNKTDFETERIILSKGCTGIKGRETIPCIGCGCMREGSAWGTRVGVGYWNFCCRGRGIDSSLVLTSCKIAREMGQTNCLILISINARL